MLVPIASIKVGNRILDLKEKRVLELVESIKDVGGLIHPIAVYEGQFIRENDTVYLDGYGLIAGLHRLEACKRLGKTEIEVHVMKPKSENERTVLECDENLTRDKLNKADKAKLTKIRKSAHEALHPETRKGSAGGQAFKEKMAKQAKRGDPRLASNTNENKEVKPVEKTESVPSYTKATAESTGKSVRVVQEEQRRIKLLCPEIWDLAEEHPKVGTNKFLDDLIRAKLSHAEQVASMHAAIQARAEKRSASSVPTMAKTPKKVIACFEKLKKDWAAAPSEAREMFREFLRSDTLKTNKPPQGHAQSAEGKVHKNRKELGNTHDRAASNPRTNLA